MKLVINYLQLIRDYRTVDVSIRRDTSNWYTCFQMTAWYKCLIQLPIVCVCISEMFALFFLMLL